MPQVSTQTKNAPQSSGTENKPANAQVETALENTAIKLPETPEVTHLRQVHKVENATSKELFENSVKSQFEIAKTILENQDSAVFLESLYEDYTPEVYQKMTADSEQGKFNMKSAAEFIFNDGLPENLEDLNDLQKEFLYENGAANTLFYLGELKEIHATITPEKSNDIDNAIKEKVDNYITELKNSGINSPDRFVAKNALTENDPEMNKLILEKREEIATTIIKDFLNNPENEGRSVLLIYGAAHEFSDDFAKHDINFNSQDTLTLQQTSNASPKSSLESNTDFQDLFLPELSDIQKSSVPDLDSFKGDYSDALVEYGSILRNGGVREQVIKQQERLLDVIERDGGTLEAWQWQHFDKSLMERGLGVLNPESIGKISFPTSSLKNIATKHGGSLETAIHQWIKDHGL